MIDKPAALVTMRLADMTRMHPAQDDSRVCGACGAAVGIYPSGQAVLRKWPDLKIMCAQCATARPALAMPAADLDVIMQEGRDSFDVGRG